MGIRHRTGAGNNGGSGRSRFLFAKLLQFLKKRRIDRGDFAFQRVGAAQLKKVFEVHRIWSVEQEAEKLDDVTRFVAKQISTGMAQVVLRRIPSSAGVQE